MEIMLRLVTAILFIAYLFLPTFLVVKFWHKRVLVIIVNLVSLAAQIALLVMVLQPIRRFSSEVESHFPEELAAFLGFTVLTMALSPLLIANVTTLVSVTRKQSKNKKSAILVISSILSIAVAVITAFFAIGTTFGMEATPVDI